MKIVVCDANIFIDLLQADLLPAYLNLGYKNHAPPGVIEEVKEQVFLTIVSRLHLPFSGN